MSAIRLNPLGSTGLHVTSVALGTSPLASMPALYGYEVDDDRAEATIDAMLESSINFIDTSNNYGGGSAETRIGRVLARRGGLPDGVVLATKVDGVREVLDFSAARVGRSTHESLERLGLERVQLMYLHDPEFYLTAAEAMAPGGPVEALVSLRDEGVIGAIGVAAGDVALMIELAVTDVFDVMLNHNRFTLLDRSAEPLIDTAVSRGMAYVNAAPYGGGILSKGPDVSTSYGYRPADDDVLAAVRGMQALCRDAGVPLAAAALQFSLRDPRIASTVVGVSTPERVAETVAFAELDIPDGLWAELDALAPDSTHWLA
jgi:D-threo-aldose 1-dehydrogenase